MAAPVQYQNRELYPEPHHYASTPVHPRAGVDQRAQYYLPLSPRYPPPSHQAPHYVAERYDPYRHPPPKPRLLPSYAPHPSLADHPPGPSYDRAYVVDQPSGRYHPSRGAQRDAKWHARYAERSHPMNQPNARPGRVPPPQSRFAPQVGRQLAPMGPAARLRAEQQAAIAAARRDYAESVAKAQVKEENDRKIKRIQLQVYVHARTTPCWWRGCQAELDSWALLEKHLYNCHLHRSLPGPSTEYPVQCKWDTCTQTFTTRKECYHHCLTGHMWAYCARCPFNCLFEGGTFDELMAHIGRRHPSATPDDFVPGLIHHRPLYLPPSKDHLPKLPQFVVIRPEHDLTPEITPACPPVKACAEISQRVKRRVERACFSGRRPRKDHFIDRQGASAAISAVIENSRRIAEAYAATQEGDKDNLEQPPSTAKSAGVTIQEATEQGVNLMDIKKTARYAKDLAQAQLANDVVVLGDSSSDSHEGSPATLRQGEGGPRPTVVVRLTRSQKPRQELEDGDESTASETESSASSDYSLYKGPTGSVTESPAEGDHVKRSERLKRKAASDRGSSVDQVGEE